MYIYNSAQYLKALLASHSNTLAVLPFLDNALTTLECHDPLTVGEFVITKHYGPGYWVSTGSYQFRVKTVDDVETLIKGFLNGDLTKASYRAGSSVWHEKQPLLNKSRKKGFFDAAATFTNILTSNALQPEFFGTASLNPTEGQIMAAAVRAA